MNAYFVALQCQQRLCRSRWNIFTAPTTLWMQFRLTFKGVRSQSLLNHQYTSRAADWLAEISVIMQFLELRFKIRTGAECSTRIIHTKREKEEKIRYDCIEKNTVVRMCYYVCNNPLAYDRPVEIWIFIYSIRKCSSCFLDYELIVIWDLSVRNGWCRGDGMVDDDGSYSWLINDFYKSFRSALLCPRNMPIWVNFNYSTNSALSSIRKPFCSVCVEYADYSTMKILPQNSS